ncbi:MAG: DedA family protein [Chloroflexota bacterium]
MAAIVGLLLLFGLVAAFLLLRPNPASLAALGYPGVAILMFLSSSSILLPAPGFAAVLAAGTIWNPLLVGVAGGLGAATGELTGYLVGLGGGAVLDLREGKRWQQAHRWLARYGFWAIVGVALVPNPVFDVLGLVAGSLSYPARRFWLACVLGNTLKYLLLAYLAGSATDWWLDR